MDRQSIAAVEIEKLEMLSNAQHRYDITKSSKG
jgi:hypothetical protein